MRTLLQMSLVVGVMLVVLAATAAAQPGAKGAPCGLPAVQARVAALEAELATVVEELAVLRGTAGATAVGLAILDRATNLMWEKKVEGAGLHGVDAAFAWCEATGSTSGVCAGNRVSWIGAVNQSGLAAFSNWRCRRSPRCRRWWMPTSGCRGSIPSSRR